jgi:glycosyltransferase involved in cell wall biosynthesis
MSLLELTTRRRGWRRYLELIPRTVRSLRQQRADVLVVQSPSIVLSLLCTVLRPWLGYRLVVDAHNDAIFSPWRAFQPLTRWLVKAADLVIVTNRPLADVVVRFGSTPFVLPDPIPSAPDVEESGLQPPPGTGLRIAVVATYALDEPIAAVLSAAASVGNGYQFSLTGNPAKLSSELRVAASENVNFTGFLPEAEYWRLLRNSDVVMDLTLLENCLVCGAYEALAVERPMILSDNAASIELFGEAALYTDNSPASIQAAVERAGAELAGLRAGASAVRQRLQSFWSRHSQELVGTLLRLATDSPHNGDGHRQSQG